MQIPVSLLSALWRNLTWCLVLLLMSWPGSLSVLALERDSVEKEIHRLTNQLRQEKNLPPLAPLPGLYQLARKHSEAMASQGFFAHTDPQGRGPSERMKLFLPGLLAMGSGENIAMRSEGQEDEMELALALFTQWKHSPGHYANMVSKDYRHLGVGVALENGNVYATQNFANGLVQLQSGPPAKVESGPAVKMKFEFLADFPPAEVSVFVHVPDTQARFYTSGGSFYTGGGPISPVWLDKTHFEINLPTDKGLGTYSLGIGQNGAYYNTPFGFEVVASLSWGTGSDSYRVIKKASSLRAEF